MNWMTMFWVIFGILFGVSGCLFFVYFKDKLRQIHESIDSNYQNTHTIIDELNRELSTKIDDEIKSVYESIKESDSEIFDYVKKLEIKIWDSLSKEKIESEKKNDEVQVQLSEIYNNINKVENELKALLDSRLDRMYNKIIYTVTAPNVDRDIRFPERFKDKE